MFLKCRDKAKDCPRCPKIKTKVTYDYATKSFKTRYSVSCICYATEWYDTKREAKKEWKKNYSK